MKHIILFFVLATAAFGQVTRTQVGESLKAAEAAEAQVRSERETLNGLEAAAQEQRSVLQEAAADAKVAEDRFQDLVEAYLRGPAPISTSRPGEDLNWHVRTKPTPAMYDWTVEGTTFTSQRGLGTIQGGYGDAYRLSREAGVVNVVFGVTGSTGSARVGGTWGQTGPDVLAYPGDEKASATFVGMTPTSSVHLAFSSVGSSVQATGDVLAFDIGLRGTQDTFVIRANGGSDHIQLDGCWFLNPAEWGPETTNYASGLHIDGWDTLVIRNHKWRGETPDSPGINFREHPIAYLKSGKTSTLIEGCDMYGGNRTGFQKRPGSEYQPLPTDRLMVRNNYCDSYGSNHEFGDGGAVYTVWCSSASTYIYDNVATNFRFQALVISGQTPAINFDFLDSGNQHNAVYISGNRFIPGPLTERDTVSISSCDEVHIWGDNEFVGKVNLDAEWNWNVNGTSNQREYIYADVAPLWHLVRFIPGEGDYVLTTEDKDALLVN
tara:strand:- start:47327 stop:48802 length:1476 start_codon:yes stop_codon:yes gene_type:complete